MSGIRRLGAIILERGTDHAMAPYPLRDQEGRQAGGLGGPLLELIGRHL